MHTSSKTARPDAHRLVVPAPRLRDEPGIRFGLAHAGLIGAALVAAATRMPESPSFALIALVAAAGGARLAAHWRIGVAMSGWAIWTGFLGNTLGVLTFSRPDLARLVVLLVLAVVRLRP